MTMFVPRIMAELPDGWSALDAAEYYGPGGSRVRVTGEPVEPGLDTAGLAELHSAILSDQIAGYREIDVRDVTAFAGQPAVRRDVAFGENGDVFRGLAIYLVRDGVGYIASGTSRADRFEATEDDVMSLASGLTILGTPVLVGPPDDQNAADDDGSIERSAPGDRARPPLSSAEWAPLHEGWIEAGEPQWLDDDSALVLSNDECVLAAAVLGAGVFPTVGPHTLAALPSDQRSVVGQAITRSLVTRGVLDVDDGQVIASRTAEPVLDAVLYPDLLVETARFVGPDVEAAAFAVRIESMAVVETHGTYGRRIDRAPSVELVDRVLAFGHLIGLRAGDGPEREVDIAELDQLVWLRSTWREATALVGGELRWAVLDGALFDAELVGAKRPERVVIRPSSTDSARALLIDHLP